MSKYDLIREFFADPEDAVKFFVQLRVLRFANRDGSCVASLEKQSDAKWIYLLEWQDGKYIGECIKPFKPSLENITKFNTGCAVVADLMEEYIKSGDDDLVTSVTSPFGDLVCDES